MAQMSNGDTERMNNDEAHDERADEGRETRSSDEMIEMSEEAADLVKTLESERDEALAARQRALADFQNYQRRAAESERRARQHAAVSIVRSILPVLDHFDYALDQEGDNITVEQLIGGVKMVRDELRKALEANGVERMEPEVGEEFDPNRHEAMMRQPTSEIDPNHIARVLQSGYVMGEHVLRPAKVVVAAEEAKEPTEEQN